MHRRDDNRPVPSDATQMVKCAKNRTYAALMLGALEVCVVAAVD